MRTQGGEVKRFSHLGRAFFDPIIKGKCPFTMSLEQDMRCTMCTKLISTKR